MSEGKVVKITNKDATVNLKVTELISKESILAPGVELDIDPNTVEVQVQTV